MGSVLVSADPGPRLSHSFSAPDTREEPWRETDSVPSKRKENVQLGNNAGGGLNRIALEDSKSPVAEYASGALMQENAGMTMSTTNTMAADAPESMYLVSERSFGGVGMEVKLSGVVTSNYVIPIACLVQTIKYART